MTAAGAVRLGLSWARKTKRYAGRRSFCGSCCGTGATYASKHISSPLFPLASLMFVRQWEIESIS